MFSEQIDANIAFLPSRILARSVFFRCHVSTHRNFLISISWGMQIISSTAPGAMLMSWFTMVPKSTSFLFPGVLNGTRCYVNELVPELNPA